MEKITENISTSGRLMGGQRPSVLGKVVFDSKNVEEGNILFKDFLSPDDIEGIIKAKGIVLTSGAELSHMGLQVKEKGKLATIIKGVRFIKSKEKDEKGKEEEKIIAAEIKYMEYTGTSQIVNGFKVKDVVEKTIIVREGDVLAIDGETGRLIIFEKDVVNGTSKDKAKVEEYKKYKSTTVSVVQEEKTEKQAKQKVEVERKQVWDMDYTESKDNIYSNFIKGFKNIADTIKKYFGTKATNL